MYQHLFMLMIDLYAYTVYCMDTYITNLTKEISNLQISPFKCICRYCRLIKYTAFMGCWYPKMIFTNIDYVLFTYIQNELTTNSCEAVWVVITIVL